MNYQKPPYSSDVVNQTVEYGGATWKGNPGQDWVLQSAGGGGNGVPTTQSILDAAKQARDFNIQSNQPAISTLQTTSTDLKTRYQDLIESIKGQQGVAENSATLATNNELARRGITNDSGLAEQERASALRPIAANYQGLTANAGLESEKDLSNIAREIASLQSGNPEGSLQFGSNVGNLQQQAYQFAADLAYKQQAQQEATRQFNADMQYKKDYTSTLSKRYITLGDGGMVFDTQTGQLIAENQKDFKAGSGVKNGFE